VESPTKPGSVVSHVRSGGPMATETAGGLKGGRGEERFSRSVWRGGREEVWRIGR